MYPDTPSESWSPNNVEMLGETHNYDDQMPGGTGSKAEFYAAYYRLKGGTAQAINTAADTSNGTIYVSSKISASDYRIGDKGCSS